MIQRIRGKCNYGRTTLEQINETSWKFGSFWIHRIGGHDDMAEIKWKAKMNGQPRKVNDTNEDIPTRHKEESVMFKSELPKKTYRFWI